jgi:hypothetical protein
LWLSFLTITSHGRSEPLPGPVLRGLVFRTGGATVDMPRVYRRPGRWRIRESR